jgi:hypothetical protein
MRKLLAALLLITGPLLEAVPSQAADLAQQYRISLGSAFAVPATVILCPSSDGSFTTVACNFSGGGTGGSVTQGTVPWVTADQNLANAYIANAGTAPAGVIVQGGIYNTTEPTLTTGTVGREEVDVNGNTLINIKGGLGAGYGAPLFTSPEPAPAPNSANFPNVGQNTTAASSLVLKASAGALYSISISDPTAAGFLMVFNSATVPADGTVTPVECLPVSINGYAALTYNPYGEWFTTGISVALSSTGCFTKTTVPTGLIHGQYK